jgi:hypothetical protein
MVKILVNLMSLQGPKFQKKTAWPVMTKNMRMDL